MDSPVITIITPTIQRQSLLDTCRSVDNQGFIGWRHILVVDRLNRDEELLAKIVHPQRVIFFCPQEHRNGGNTCRASVYDSATGDYVYYLDDDVYFVDDMVLEDMVTALYTAENPDWALFPINYLGNYFFHDPPALSFVDTANVIVKREFARWPDIEIHESDWVYIQNLLATRPYKSFPEFRPIVNYRKMGSGPGGRDGSQ